MNNTEQLIHLAQNGDEQAAERLITENSGLIWSIARRFTGRGVELDDLFQLGCLGFIKAVRGFDLEFGTQFSTYAVPKISGEIRRYLRDDGTVKVSRSIKERAFTIRNAKNNLVQQLGREPTVFELEKNTGISVEDIVIAENATSCVESMQQENGEEGLTLENILSDTESEDKLLDRISLKEAINKLSEREAMVINLRYYHGLTQERVAKIIRVSQVQVSRIEKHALGTLRELLR